jgi:hypothetical protein
MGCWQDHRTGWRGPAQQGVKTYLLPLGAIVHNCWTWNSRVPTLLASCSLCSIVSTSSSSSKTGLLDGTPLWRYAGCVERLFTDSMASACRLFSEHALMPPCLARRERTACRVAHPIKRGPPVRRPRNALSVARATVGKASGSHSGTAAAKRKIMK